ncbi:hypothetical protein [Aquimarina rhabdastrellae]
MKNSISILLFMIGYSIYAQQTTDFFPASTELWVEDFIGYDHQTGFSGTGDGNLTNSGEYPANVSKWTLDGSGISLANAYKGYVNNTEDGDIYRPSFWAENTQGELVWETEEIDVSGNAKVYMKVVLEETGDHSPEDYIDVYWQVVGVGNFIKIDEDGSGHTVMGTDDDADACSDNDWRSMVFTKDLTVTDNQAVKIRVVFNSTAPDRILKLNKVQITGSN